MMDQKYSRQAAPQQAGDRIDVTFFGRKTRANPMLARLLRAPGKGPGERTRRTGYFRIQIHTRTSAGARYLGAVEAQGDPGYAATSVMLGETALCLALDRDQLPDCAGVLTPATAMGAALTARLRSAGHTLTTRQTTQLPGSSGRLPLSSWKTCSWTRA